MHTAYDYDKQAWVQGPLAKALLTKQQRERLELLESIKGDEYCRMIGRDKQEELANAHWAIAQLTLGG